MKPLLQKPRFGLAWTSLWGVLIGLLLLWVGMLGGPSPTLVAVASVFLLIGVLIWQESRGGLWAGVLVFGVMALLHATRTLGDFHWRYLIYCIAFAQLSYECYQGLRRLPDAEGPSQQHPHRKTQANSKDKVAAEDKPMISLVLLQRKQKYLEDRILSKILEASWGGDYPCDSESAPEQEETADGGFVVGENPLFVVKAPTGIYLVHNVDADYWQYKAKVVAGISELRMRKAVEDHHAWLAVDMLTPGDEQPDMDEAYQQVARLLVALADEDTLAVVRPEVMDIKVWSEEVAERLLTPGAYKELAHEDNAPVIAIADDDPAMQAAVATAQRRWPEFVAAFGRRGGTPTPQDEGNFVVKARITEGDSTEYIWVDVIGLEPKYVHGKLANDPVELGDLKLGSQVEFPIEDVCDWCYLENEEPIGMFSLAAILQAQQAKDEANQPNSATE